jgi:hypothetical protein
MQGLEAIESKPHWGIHVTNRRLRAFESNRRPAMIAQPWSLKKWAPRLNDLDINVVRKDANEMIA